MGLRQGLRRRALQEGAGGGVERRAEEVVRRGVADVELDGGVEGRQVDEVGLAELARLGGRAGGQGLGAELGDGAGRLILKVEPSSPSILRRTKTTLAASTCVARPEASRVNLSGSLM